MNAFAEQYRNAGGEAKFVGTHAHDAFLDQMKKTCSAWNPNGIP